MSKKPITGRIDCVFIRKSTKAQDEQGQIGNVTAMLKALGVYVPDPYWFVCTVPRANVQANSDFNRLMELVKAGKVGTVYIESQDRWGTGFVSELFSLLRVLSGHGTRLYDLKDKTDLTGTDDATEMKVFLGGFKSKKEREDLAYRSLRSKVSLLKELGSRPGSVQPYGYGKACYATDGRLLWVWQPLTRHRGQVFYPDAAGKLTPGPSNVKVPRKTGGQRERTVLVPSNDPERIRAVKLIFDLYTRIGLSRRQICTRLNGEGMTFYGKPFNHCDVGAILDNPVYAGDTLYGKVQVGKFHSFDGNGAIVRTGGRPAGGRNAAECLVKPNSHEGLVDRHTWELAQKKLAAERERKSWSPRNPAHYLKQILVCGHCGKGMTGRMETHPTTKDKTAVYVCSTYMKEQSRGSANTCGYQRITHADAEQLLLDKIREVGLPFEEDASDEARDNLKARLARLGHEDKETFRRWKKWTDEAIMAFIAYLKETYDLKDASLARLGKAALLWYRWGGLTPDLVASLPATPSAPLPTWTRDGTLKLTAGQTIVKEYNEALEFKEALEDGTLKLTPEHQAALKEFKEALQEAEEAAVGQARQKLAELREEHKALTRSWAKATDAMQVVLKEEIQRLEAAIREWEPRTKPISERLKALDEAVQELLAQYRQLLDEWPSLENREKGEALRRLFKQVTLFWERTWHPTPKKPTRPRKTRRPGRYSYTLQKDRIQWAFAVADLTSDGTC